MSTRLENISTQLSSLTRVVLGLSPGHHDDTGHTVTTGVHSDTSDNAVNKSGKLDTLHDIRCTTQFSFTFLEGKSD